MSGEAPEVLLACTHVHAHVPVPTCPVAPSVFAPPPLGAEDQPLIIEPSLVVSILLMFTHQLCHNCVDRKSFVHQARAEFNKLSQDRQTLALLQPRMGSMHNDTPLVPMQLPREVIEYCEWTGITHALMTMCFMSIKVTHMVPRDHTQNVMYTCHRLGMRIMEFSSAQTSRCILGLLETRIIDSLSMGPRS